MRFGSVSIFLLVILGCAVAGGCAPASSSGVDGPDDVALAAGKADGTAYNACELRAVVSGLNQGDLGQEELKDGGVHAQAAGHLVEHLAGKDGTLGTSDDLEFASIDEVDRTPYVGPAALRQLVALFATSCSESGDSRFEVIMSPQPIAQSHVARVLEEVRRATRSIDIAMYSFRDEEIKEALGEAVDRGVRVRMIYEGASEDRKDPMGTTSAQAEDLGIDVRWVNKIMHHKFAIIDGVQTASDDPSEALLVTGSGNWSYGAATQFNENTLFIQGEPGLVLQFQQEFNHLWENSREFEWNKSLSFVSTTPVDPDSLSSDFASVAFTSDNFEVRPSSTYGPTFTTVRGRNTVSDALVRLIDQAEDSIVIASGHLRSRPVAEALISAAKNNPSLDVRIYLDGQEYISTWYHQKQLDDLDACLAGASTETQTQDCYDKGFYFGYAVHKEGIAVRYKYYAYRWDYSYAPQMHHKYMVVDGRFLATGSYNLSDNAEHNTFENMVFIDGAAHGQIVEKYLEDFESIWATDAKRQGYDALLDKIENETGPFPVVFDSMALDWDEVTRLKLAIRDACPDIDSDAFRREPAAHQTCYR